MASVNNLKFRFNPQIPVLIFLLGWFIFFQAKTVDLTTADLGRHLKNGQLVLQGEFALLNSNFYSYTHPDFAMVNHHWGAGVIFFLIERIFGFVGLCAFYIVLSLIIFCLFFHLAQKESGWQVSTPVALLLIPLMASRTEVRPEIFSYLFVSVFFWILWHLRQGLLSQKWLFALPLAAILWVNTHIYFVFGPFLIGLFWFEQFLHRKKGEQLKKLALTFGLTVTASLINPFSLRGIIYPFNIFRNYGYKIVENQSVWFLERLDIVNNPNLGLYKIAFIVLVVSYILALLRNRRSFSIIYFSLAFVFSTLAWLAIRNFTLFGFFALPIISYNIKQALGPKINLNFLSTRIAVFALSTAIFIIILFTHYQHLPWARGRFGLGLVWGNSLSAEFFIKEDIQGPILNNYDIGSYLIYYLYPQRRVFVDNRPEAYPVSFFKQVYIPLQEDELVWQKQDRLFNFNAIFFAHHDATPWGQEFLVTRIDDPLWAPVFADHCAIIFLKRNALNQPIINKYELARENFRVIENK